MLHRLTTPSSTYRGVAAYVLGGGIAHKAIPASRLWETVGLSKTAESVGRRAAQTCGETLKTGEGVQRDEFIETAP